MRIAHRSGISNVDGGVGLATNYTGLIPLPDGQRIAIAVFVTDSNAREAIRGQMVARIARAAYDESRGSTSPAGKLR